MIAAVLVVARLALQGTGAPQISVTQAVDHALASHPSIASARAARDHAAADVADARSASRPRLNLDAALNQFEKPMVVLPLHGLDLRNPPLFDRSLVQSGLSAGWTIYDFGVRSAHTRVESALGDAASAALSSAEIDLVARTVDAYVRVLTVRGVLAAEDERITALAAERDRVRQMIAQGKAAAVDLARSDAEWQRARADRISSASDLEVAEQDLAQLAALPATSIHASPLMPLRLADSAYAADTSVAVRTGLVERANRASADVQTFEQRLAAARAGVNLAHANGMPALSVSGAYVDRGRLKGDFAAEWQVGMAVSYPLYMGGVRENGIQRASADERMADAQLRLARLGVEQGIDRALAAVRQAHARSAALDAAVTQSADVARIERLSLDVGSGTQTDYLSAEASLMSARASLVEAQHAEITARVELARIVGDLSRDWLVRTVEPRQ